MASWPVPVVFIKSKGWVGVKGIVNGNIITAQGILNKHILIFDHTIRQIIREEEISQYHLSETIDANGGFVSPGFIDLHVHGCSGFDTMDDDPQALTMISQHLLKTGVTSFLPTTMTMEMGKINQCLERIRHAMNHYKGGAHILGCHMEGPFINKANKGAQHGRYIMPAEFKKIKPYVDVIKMITLAPELVKDDTFIKNCVQQGIVVSIGHSSATYEQAKVAIEAGASHMTHTFNALPPVHHRTPGAIGAAMDSEKVVCELIADNIHVHPFMQRLLLTMKGLDKIILITDAMRACMLCDGQYDLGGQMVTLDQGEARLSDGALAGSVLCINQAVKNFIKNTGLDLVHAIGLVTVNPARQLGMLAKKGSLEIGRDADIIIFDDSLEISTTIVSGHVVYQK